jgi:hypothetical protein
LLRLIIGYRSVVNPGFAEAMTAVLKKEGQ